MEKSINKTSLAQKYGWTLDFLVKKINSTSELYQELKFSANYNPYQRIFTPKQVEIIYNHFGKPSTVEV